MFQWLPASLLIHGCHFHWNHLNFSSSSPPPIPGLLCNSLAGWLTKLKRPHKPSCSSIFQIAAQTLNESFRASIPVRFRFTVRWEMWFCIIPAKANRIRWGLCNQKETSSLAGTLAVVNVDERESYGGVKGQVWPSGWIRVLMLECAGGVMRCSVSGLAPNGLWSH